MYFLKVSLAPCKRLARLQPAVMVRRWSWLLLGAMVALSLQLSPLSQANPVRENFWILSQKSPRRLIAIDNVCAWPNLSLLRDGTLIATIFNQPNHGLTEGDAECWASEDDGLSWRYRGRPTKHDPHTNRMNVAAGTNSKGELVVLCSGWDNVRPRRNEQSRPLQATVSTSSDGGRNWKIKAFEVSPVKGLSQHVPFGDVLVAKNRDLVVGTYVFDATPSGRTKGRKREGHVYAVRSQDNGKTWSRPNAIVKDIHVEAAMLHLGQGHWLAASRRFGYLDLDLHVSGDDALTWRHLKTLGVPSVSAAHLLKLSDGRILLTYGNRSPGNYGIDARLSKDGGSSWSYPQRLVDLDRRDCGYPAAVELPEGRLLIAYYVSGIKEHDRYHMGVVHLHLDDLSESGLK